MKYVIKISGTGNRFDGEYDAGDNLTEARHEGRKMQAYVMKERPHGRVRIVRFIKDPQATEGVWVQTIEELTPVTLGMYVRDPARRRRTKRRMQDYRKRRSRRDPRTFAEIRELTRQAHEDPEAIEVLHDALMETFAEEGQRGQSYNNYGVKVRGGKSVV